MKTRNTRNQFKLYYIVLNDIIANTTINIKATNNALQRIRK